MKRIVMVACAAVVGLYLALVAFFAVAQRSFLFPAPARARPPRGHVLAAQGFRGIWIAPPPGAPVVIHFHGNGEDLADLDPIVELLAATGAGVLAVEYPGYGISGADGPPREESMYSAGAAAIAYVRDRFPASEVVLEGQSLGTGVAAELAARGLGARLILIAPYTSMVEVAATHFPWLPVGLLLRDRFDTASKAARIAIPVLLIHGSEDQVVPAWMSGELERRFPHARRILIRGGHHNDLLFRHAGDLRGALAGFLAR